ncbi:uncharacterized protein MKK02DRAFT_45167 [Dioszegia hungarica]|uniref:Uncharacterized protein n=1 Tax=Dioszegia hungarica TaxID=4972 RepID=A0AA38HCL2_9TREE|nr:uncharacterized protein MKK02DRAFT_45167 [Dioszegia hungarica]KAI9636461.1 hypothetical protein MKK02DRAFT_45167 [Dioszegia hungarica]
MIDPILIRTPPILHPDILVRILYFCPRATQAVAARLSKDLHELAITALYRHLSLNFDSPHPLSRGHSYQTAYTPTPNPNPNISLIRSLHVFSTNTRGRSALSSIPASSLAIPNLRSLHIQLDADTNRWPQSGTLARSLLEPGPPELILSADEGCDVLRWLILSRCMERIPSGVRTLVIQTSYGRAGVRGGGNGRSWPLSADAWFKSVVKETASWGVSPFTGDISLRVQGHCGVEGEARRSDGEGNGGQDEQWSEVLLTLARNIAILRLLAMRRTGMVRVMLPEVPAPIMRISEVKEPGGAVKGEERKLGLIDMIQLAMMEMAEWRGLREDVVDQAMAGIEVHG